MTDSTEREHIVLVCGSRTWTDSAKLRAALDEVVEERGPVRVIHGAAKGADRMAATWAALRRMDAEAYPVSDQQWRQDGKVAGIKRNGLMVRRMNKLRKEGYTLSALAFRSQGQSRGTDHMVRILREANIKVEVIWGQADRVPVTFSPHTLYVCGDRTFGDYPLVEKYLTLALKKSAGDLVVAYEKATTGAEAVCKGWLAKNPAAEGIEWLRSDPEYWRRERVVRLLEEARAEGRSVEAWCFRRSRDSEGGFGELALVRRAGIGTRRFNGKVARSGRAVR